MKNQGKRTIVGLLFGCALLSAQTPGEAWASLREHGTQVQEAYSKYDSSFSILQEMMGHAGPQFAADRQKLRDFRDLIALRHRDVVYGLWSSQGGGAIANALRLAKIDFDRLNAMKPRFLALAAQMESSKTPAAEKEFVNYLAVFAGTLKRLDEGQFQFVYNKMAGFAADCAQHGNAVGRFSEPTRLAIDAYSARLRPASGSGRQRFDNEMNQMRARREALFVFLAQWDATQGRNLAAANVTMNDWRRIHVDSENLAKFLSSPDFVKDLPHIDASNAMDTLARIGGYLQTYR